jgi:hypothetical protein
MHHAGWMLKIDGWMDEKMDGWMDGWCVDRKQFFIVFLPLC